MEVLNEQHHPYRGSTVPERSRAAGKDMRTVRHFPEAPAVSPLIQGVLSEKMRRNCRIMSVRVFARKDGPPKTREVVFPLVSDGMYYSIGESLCPPQVSLKDCFNPSDRKGERPRNRMFKTAAGTGFMQATDRRPNRKALAYYEAIARGGIGILLCGSSGIDDIPPCRLCYASTMMNLFPLTANWLMRSINTAAPHFFGADHFERPLLPEYAVAASAVAYPSPFDMNNNVPRPLTVADIREKVDKFAGAAVRAQKAGFDGVEINAASSHLLATFLSRFWNKREDIYGYATLENRSRFVVEIIQEIKKRLGSDFPVTVLMNAFEVNVVKPGANEDCLTISEAQGIAQILEKAGADAIHVRIHTIGDHLGGFLPETMFWPTSRIALKSFPEAFDSSHHGAGGYVPAAGMIKRVVSIPVMTVGRLDPLLGDEAIRQGQVDFIGFNRRLIADPELPNKVAAGRLDDIAPCTACINCFTPTKDMHCRINAACGSEDQYILQPAKKRKKVLVAGGGPAGMEAARVAALRGHEVILYERNSSPGGLLPVAAIVKGTIIEDLPAVVRYLFRQITRVGVDIRLGQEVTRSVIEQVKPDVLIAATGGLPSDPHNTGDQ